MRIDKDTLFMRYPSAWWHDLWRKSLPSGNLRDAGNEKTAMCGFFCFCVEFAWILFDKHRI